MRSIIIDIRLLIYDVIGAYDSIFIKKMFEPRNIVGIAWRAHFKFNALCFTGAFF